jgi:hypothetical protein
MFIYYFKQDVYLAFLYELYFSKTSWTLWPYTEGPHATEVSDSTLWRNSLLFEMSGFVKTACCET